MKTLHLVLLGAAGAAGLWVWKTKKGPSGASVAAGKVVKFPFGGSITLPVLVANPVPVAAPPAALSSASVKSSVCNLAGAAVAAGVTAKTGGAGAAAAPLVGGLGSAATCGVITVGEKTAKAVVQGAKKTGAAVAAGAKAVGGGAKSVAKALIPGW